MTEQTYEWENFFEMLEYFGFDTDDILNFQEHYQNLKTPIKNFDDFRQFINEDNRR